jgi:hypothetical protein
MSISDSLHKTVIVVENFSFLQNPEWYLSESILYLILTYALCVLKNLIALI